MNTDEIVRQLVRERPGKDFVTFDYDQAAPRRGRSGWLETRIAGSAAPAAS